jgi:hypothetical protein
MGKNRSDNKLDLLDGGPVEFDRWQTPFENSEIEIIEVIYAPEFRWSETGISRYRKNSSIKEGKNSHLSILIQDDETDKFYRISFKHIVAIRLMDEGGLEEIWSEKFRLEKPVGLTTFQVRNHSWVKESILEFLKTDGWAYMIATRGNCLEIVSTIPPTISEEVL